MIVALLLVFLFQSHLVRGLIYIGQPSAVAIGLSMFAYWSILKHRWSALGVVFLGLGLALKPQIAGLIFLLLLANTKTRKQDLWAAGLALGLMIAAAGFLQVHSGTQHWYRDYQAQLSDSLHIPGVNDPTWRARHGTEMLNLQATFAVLDRPSFYNLLSWATFCGLFLPWLKFTCKALGTELSQVAVSAFIFIGLLPVYHREYDLPMLALTFPGLAMLLVHRRRAALGVCFITIPLLYSAIRPGVLGESLLFAPRIVRLVPLTRLRVVLFTRPDPVLLFSLATIYLLAMRQSPRSEWEQSSSEASLNTRSTVSFESAGG